MSTFTFSDYQTAAAAAQNKSSATKVGYFKLNDGEEALVRFNVSGTEVNEGLTFASVHKAIFGKRFEGLTGFGGVNCINEFNSFDNKCPFCAAAAAGHSVIDKVKKFVYIPMIVSYKDATTGQWAAPVPVIWERPAGYAREIATALNDYGDLRKQLLKISRIGAGKDTRYTLAYARPEIFKPEMIPEDFSAFNGFDITKHSFWVKTAEEMNDYVATGAFATKNEAAPVEPQVPSNNFQPAANVNTNTQTFSVPEAVQMPPVTPQTVATESPAAKFNGFTF